MSFIEIKLIILKYMPKYFVFHILNKFPTKITNDVNLFSKNNLFISNYTIFKYFFLLKLFYKIQASILF